MSTLRQMRKAMSPEIRGGWLNVGMSEHGVKKEGAHCVCPDQVERQMRK